MRTACVECGLMVGHYATCTADPPPQRTVADPLLWDAIVQSDRHQTWTA